VEQLGRYPGKLAVARVLIENGLAIRNGKIYWNQIEVPAKSVARVAKVDPRTVKHTLRPIEDNGELKPIFKYLRSAGQTGRAEVPVRGTCHRVARL
jgi:predicted regulator of amino acid metabolism with ACT domain